MDGKKTTAEWPELKSALRRLLQKAVEYCVLEGTIEDTDRLNYLMSGKCRQHSHINILHYHHLLSVKTFG